MTIEEDTNGRRAEPRKVPRKFVVIANAVGNGRQMLQNIDGTSRNLVQLTGMGGAVILRRKTR